MTSIDAGFRIKHPDTPITAKMCVPTGQPDGVSDGDPPRIEGIRSRRTLTMRHGRIEFLVFGLDPLVLSLFAVTHVLEGLVAGIGTR